MNREEEWLKTSAKIIEAVDKVDTPTPREKVIKYAIEFLLIKMCQSEELFNDNLEILDKYAENGRERNKQYVYTNNKVE